LTPGYNNQGLTPNTNIIKKSGDTFDFQNNDKEFDSILSFIEMNAEFADELVTSINKVTVEL